MNFSTIIALGILLSAAPCFARPEKYYQDRWCAGRGVTEYPNIDGTRTDCLTDTMAVEVDFARKYAEAIGQALHYGRVTGKVPAILLIIEKPSDWKYYYRMVETVVFYELPIEIFIMTGE